MAAVCSGVSSMPEKIKTVPPSTPLMAPKGLKACEKFNLRAALSGAPNCAMNGFDAVSKKETQKDRRRPQPRLEAGDGERLHELPNQHVVQVRRNTPKEKEHGHQEE